MKRLYILGKNSDDKGKQLEQLSSSILESQGYGELVLNVQGSGGNEIDVTAKLVNKTGIHNTVQQVICECKAHESPIDMNDWLKFIGKLHIERKTVPNTIGLMIALTGAKGTVVGSKDKDFSGDNTVQLIANDGLIDLLTEMFGLPTCSQIKEKVLSISEKPDIDFDLNLIYYDHKIYWIVDFQGRFIILSKDGLFLPDDEQNMILNLLPTFTPYDKSHFWDIKSDLETEQQRYEINRLVTERIIIEKTIQRETLLTEIKKFKNGKEVQVHQDLLNDVISRNPLIIDEGEQIRFNEDIDLFEFYKYLLSYVGVTDKIMLSKFYQSNINDALLDRILENGVVLNPVNRRNSLFLLKHSPDALSYSIIPDISYAAAKQFANLNIGENGYDMKLMFENYFLESITERFLKDYHNPILQNVFKDVKGFESGRRVIVHANDNYEIEYHLCKWKLDLK